MLAVSADGLLAALLLKAERIPTIRGEHMAIAEIGDDYLHYETSGSGEPVLFVTGLGGTAGYWRHQMDGLGSGYRTVTYDHLGIGRSAPTPPPYTVDQLTGHALRLMDALGIESTAVVGHSLGGAIAQTMAITEPRRVTKLVLSSTWTKADSRFRFLFRCRNEVLTGLGAEAYARDTALLSYPDWWINENQAEIDGRAARAAESLPPAEVILGRVSALLDFDRVDQLGEISCPTLAIAAKDDWIVPYRYSVALSQGIKGAQLDLFDSAGHHPPHTLPVEYNRKVGDFLKS